MEEQLKISQEDVKITDQFDEGGEAEVFKGVYKGIEVIIKKYKKEDNNHLKEIQAYITLQHEYMVKFYGYFIDENGIYNLVLEQAKGKLLQEMIDEEKLSFEEKVEVIIQICDFLIYLRKHHVIHLDLKPENMVINKPSEGQVCIKLFDFGISKISLNTITFTKNMNNYTINYSAPEQYITEEETMKTTLTYKIDIWALGCIISFLFSGFVPWTNKIKNPMVIQSSLIFQKSFPVPDTLDERIVPIVVLCTNISPKKRPNPNTIKSLFLLLKEGKDVKEMVSKLEAADFI